MKDLYVITDELLNSTQGRLRVKDTTTRELLHATLSPEELARIRKLRLGEQIARVLPGLLTYTEYTDVATGTSELSADVFCLTVPQMREVLIRAFSAGQAYQLARLGLKT